MTDRKRRLSVDPTPLRTSRDFRLVFISGAVTSFGSFISYVTIPYQVAKLTDDPLMVGLIGVCELAPILIMAFVGGALADYLDRRLLVRGSEAALALICGLLLINSLSDEPHLWLLYVCAFLTAAVAGLQRPAMGAMLPRLVKADQLPAAMALQSLSMQFSQLVGPSLAGILIASLDLAWVYTFDLLTFAVSLVCLTMVKSVPPPPAADRPSLNSVLTGLKYARSRPELLGTYLVDINAMFFGMPSALYPFLADRLGGPQVLGLLYAAPAVGSLLATVGSGWTQRVHRHGLMVIIAATFWGVGIVGVGLSHWLWLTLFCLAFAGAADMISGLFRMIIWNQTVPDHLRGRLAGIEMLSYTTGPLLGQLRSGMMARTSLGISGSIWVGGALCVAGSLALAAMLPRFVGYDGADGLALKQAADEEWAAGAEARAAG
ncbi:MFS transporter [Actinoplanes teichomyceticus]|uniref:Putative MFS family arabinose efflux permease n=1 Tax=Actinoplanes teichomyceticus TaxID=1867 RepID=A0A561WSB6_ACTTI|nr:MFS transporter [Actinoplanes teichomyceticus]TWG26765.1 putative MFS family arabinose efflux permease [Actinoplanes teichomyceticus]GIF15163.1 MFS transporter [Actinoplanes teichomyceticus]